MGNAGAIHHGAHHLPAQPRHHRRRWRRISATSPSASGTVPIRPTSTFSGPCATTPTTRRPACSPRSSLSPAFPRLILEDFYVKSRDAITAGTKEAPYGFILPADQEDPTRVAFVIHILRMQGIEVGRAKSAIQAQRRRLSGRLAHREDQPALRPAGQNAAGKQTDPDPDLTHLRRQRVDHGPDDQHRRQAHEGHRRPGASPLTLWTSTSPRER